MMLLALLAAPGWGAEPQSVWVYAAQPAEIIELQGLGLGFTEVQDGPWWLMHADDAELERLRMSRLVHRPAAPDSTRKGAHRTSGEMRAALDALADTHREAVELMDIGQSAEGRPITAVRISRAEDPVRSIRILGAHHGDETSSAEVTFQTAVDLLEQPAWESILEQHAVWVVPHVNPDGVDLSRRYNANSVDLNRNYGMQWSPAEFRSGPSPFSEPETQAIRALADHVAFGLGLSIHSGATNIGWVWNFTTDRSVDQTVLSSLAESYAEACTTPGFYTTNGADWYITNGDTTDWSYGRHGTLDFTLEVSAEKNPAEAEMNAVLEEHADSVRALLEWPWWIAGRVVDDETGHGIKATIEIDGGWFSTSDFTGRFSRPVGDGEWTLTATAPGYEPNTQTMSGSGEPLVMALTPSNNWSHNLPVTSHIDATGAFELAQSAIEVSLHRVGHASVDATGMGTTWRVDPDDLAPGPWSLTIDGAVAPNAVFSHRASGVTITGIERMDNVIEMTAEGIGRGTRVWGLWGRARNPVELTVVTVDDQTLRMTDLPPSDGSFDLDLLVWSNGAQIGIMDWMPPPLDTGSPPADEREPADPDARDSEPPATIVDGAGKLRASGCSVHPRYRGWAWLVTLMVLGRCRRRG